MRRMVAIADDLSGAAETAAALMAIGVGSPSARSGPVVEIVLVPADPSTLRLPDLAVPDICVLDSDGRSMSTAEAQGRLRQLLQGVASARAQQSVVFLKVDSLLRGHLAEDLAVLLDRGPVVLAPALPKLGRTTSGGVVMVNGVPLHETDLWHGEGRPAPYSIAAAIAPLPAATVGIALVRGAPPELQRALAELASLGAVAICDAETTEDLDRIANATVCLDHAQPVGSSAFGSAIFKALLPAHAAATSPRSPQLDVDGRGEGDAGACVGTPQSWGRALVVVGTASSQGREQLKELSAFGVPTITLSPVELLGGTADSTAVGTALLAGSVAVTIDSTRVDEAAPAAIAAALASFVVPIAKGIPLVLTGGATARSVLDLLGVRRLEAITEIEQGAVLSRTDQGTLVVTRPGAFGGKESLRLILDHLKHVDADTATAPQREGIAMTETLDHDDRPYIAVTMGDGAGVGPEVVVAALLDPGSAIAARPVVIGDAGRLRRAATVLGLAAEVVGVDGVGDATFEPGRINVIDLHLLPADLPWGELSAVAGDAAYQYVKVAAELALRGDVQAICTAPLNKAALHAAGHLYPGHTEMLASLTGTEEVSMMLSTEKLKVIHVTTHIGLMDAVRRIEPGLVERTIIRGHEALVRAGNPRPRIGVCAINPHAGEGGLFGQGEEAEKIEPGVRAARAAGIDVTGPLPADTLFFLAGRGDYDLVVAMYHDQGHGPVKVLGIEAGVNITVGLPVIRTSVDHGTAFDIAGKGIVDPRSMVEALRQAAEMASTPMVP